MKRSKITLTVLILSIIVLIFSGCGGGGNPVVPGDETTTDEEFNDIIDTGGNAIDKFEEYCNSIGEEQAYQMTVDFLEQQEGVKEAGIGEDGTTIWFEHENGYLVGILSTEEDEKANEKGIEIPFDQSKVVPSAEKALILNPGFNPYGTYKAGVMEWKFLSLYGDYDYESGSDVSVELMKELYQYSVIYMISHGGIIDGNECVCLKIEATSDIKDQYDYYFRNKQLAIMWIENPITKKRKPYVSITPSFIKVYNSGTFPDSLICIDACHSLENETMAKAFEKKGAYTYCGYTTTMRFGYDAPVDFFGNLISEEMNVEDAIDNLSNANNFDYYPKNHGDLYLVEDEENYPPVISKLSANPPTVNINQPTTITCIASDPDGDPLTYNWTVNAGSFEGDTSGPSVTWRAPSTADIYIVVSCEVSDGKGGKNTETLNIVVTESEEDKIKSVIRKFLQALNDQHWDEARTCCVYGSTLYDGIDDEEGLYDDEDIVDINYNESILEIIINDEYAEVNLNLNVELILSNDEVYQDSVEGWFYLQKIDSGWKLYDSLFDEDLFDDYDEPLIY